MCWTLNDSRPQRTEGLSIHRDLDLDLDLEPDPGRGTRRSHGRIGEERDQPIADDDAAPCGLRGGVANGRGNLHRGCGPQFRFATLTHPRCTKYQFGCPAGGAGSRTSTQRPSLVT